MFTGTWIRNIQRISDTYIAVDLATRSDFVGNNLGLKSLARGSTVQVKHPLGYNVA
jgi:hypothetical protein